jgi:predicted aldo/keto reductase-like oxidoreductase
MIYVDFQDKKLSLLGFGTMRLPLNADGTIDEAQTAAMTKLAMDHGVNYFDTAYPYHNGLSEIVMGKVLKAYPRDSYYLATKYPGHQLCSEYNPAEIFEEQLNKCGVEYFDFYLLHNVYEKSLDTYLDPRWGILDYFKEQKRLGRIKHLGFSTHGRADFIEKFLDICGDDMEFCQIQLNYLDWTLQDAKAKYDVLTKRGIPAWVMEPVRGGRLANLTEAEGEKLTALNSEESFASWGFRFLQSLPNVQMVLSGMSNMAQMEDNLRTFGERKPLNEQEYSTVMELAEGMKKSVPCTACRYCCDGCPAGLDIPLLISVYNDLKFSKSVNTSMLVEFMPDEQKPSACLACGKCAQICPQGISIPDVLKELDEILATMPTWAEISRQREEAAKALKKK